LPAPVVRSIGDKVLESSYTPDQRRWLTYFFGEFSPDGVFIQRDKFAFLVDKLSDEGSLALLAGTDSHDHGGVRKRDGYTLG
jgi:hypothetical protein